MISLSPHSNPVDQRLHVWAKCRPRVIWYLLFFSCLRLVVFAIARQLPKRLSMIERGSLNLISRLCDAYSADKLALCYPV